MKKIKNRFGLITVMMAVMLVFCMAGCSEVSVADKDAVAESGYNRGDAVYGYGEEAPAETIASSTADKSRNETNQKLIRTVRIEAQTQEMDTLLAQMDAKISYLGGYVESKNIRNGSTSTTKSIRTASLSIRIPAERMDEFLTHITGQSNIISMSENVEDVTLRYVATQSRITALEVEQQRLLELLEKAENMSDLLEIETRLTDVRTELEEVVSQLQLYDNLVDYGTLDLTITEVKEFEVVVEELTVWQRIGNGLSENWQGMCDGFVELFILLVVSLPFLIPVGVIAIGVILTIKICSKKGKKAVEKKQQNPPQ